MDERFVLGVNYWPRRKAMYWWSNFDRAEVADEFDVISDLGLDVVRVFLLWDDWQPEPRRVSAENLSNLGVVCDLAADRSLGLDVTFFTGHMSGPNWVPRWLLDPAAGFPSPDARQVVSGGEVVDSGYRNFFHDPEAFEAERLLIRRVVETYARHPAIWMWNLGNEPDLFARPSSSAAGAAWVEQMTELIRDLDPHHPVTCGLHAASLIDDNGLRVDQVFRATDVAVMHGYPMYADWSRGPLDADFVPFLCALTTALSGKPTLAEEWGGCTAPDGGPSTMWEWAAFGHRRSQFMAAEEDLATYVREVLPRLLGVGATGAMLWCFADYAEELWDRPPCDPDGARHERHFGLVRPDESLKPHAIELSRFAATEPRVRPAERTVTLDVTPDDYYSDSYRHVRRLYSAFVDAQRSRSTM